MVYYLDSAYAQTSFRDILDVVLRVYVILILLVSNSRIRQSTGNFVVASLLPRNFGRLGFATIPQLGLSLAYIAAGFAGSVLNAFLTDIFGRRFLISMPCALLDAI